LSALAHVQFCPALYYGINVSKVTNITTYAEEERWPDIARGYVLYREPDGSGPRFDI
jgi:hypothetical protein